MTREDILQCWAMPHISPSYPRGPYRFINREYVIITYLTDPELVRAMLPEPLEPVEQPLVAYEWIRMPDSAGFGDYTESGMVIPCRYNGEDCNFTSQMYLDDEAPIAAGREIWGFPKEYAHPVIAVHQDTVTGTLSYNGVNIAMGTMEYKAKALNHEVVKKSISKTSINLKLIPDVDGSLAIAQLVAYNIENVEVKGAWEGDARLHLVPHVHAPIADMPVRKIVGGKHYIADLTLPYGRVLHDYLRERDGHTNGSAHANAEVAGRRWA